MPVGIDQVPHLEVTREICRRFNYFYGSTFPEPESLLTEFPKVVGMDGRKMSKSYDNCIYMSDSPEVVKQKINTMVTDPQRMRRTDRGNPELSPVFQLHKIFSTKEEQAEVAEGCRTAGIGCLDCKKVLIENLLKILEPIWDKRKGFLEKPKIIEDIVHAGTKKARQVASATMSEVKRVVGLSK